MANSLATTLTDDGFNRMEPSLIHAAERGDIKAAKEALAHNPECIYETDKYSLNALQVAICSFHKEMAYFLLENTDISTRHEDALGRDALHVSIQYGGEALTRVINKQWSQERYDEMQAEKNKVVPFSPQP